jgi:hypothetical protein
MGKDLIIADAFGKRQRIHNLVQTGKDKNPAKDQPSQAKAHNLNGVWIGIARG